MDNTPKLFFYNVLRLVEEIRSSEPATVRRHRGAFFSIGDLFHDVEFGGNPAK